MAEKRGKFSGK